MPSLLPKLPSPPPGKSGWPWTVESDPLPPTMPDNQPWPKISIVTPSYNQGQFIEETIRSVLLQNYPNLEYIIMDGGSTDESVEIIRKYEAWLKYWVSERDGGQSDAIAKGFSRSSGYIMAWLNSDDLYESNAITIAAKHLMSNKCGMVYGDRNIVDEDSNIITRVCYMPFFRWQLKFRCGIAQETAFWLKNVYERVGGVDINLHYAMDYDLWWKISSVSEIDHVPVIMGSWRKHQIAKSVIISSGTGSFFEKHAKETLQVREKYMRRSQFKFEEKILMITHGCIKRLYLFCKKRFM